jgi:DNA-binding LacI/PurR family transcriptional regulator
MVAVISTDIGQAPVARVVAGMESLLRGKGYLLAVFGAFDWTSERNVFALQLQQRGIEGLMTVDAIVPSELELPVVSIDLGCVTFREPLAAGVHTWLTELGKSAAEAVLGQIENKCAPRRAKIIPEFRHNMLHTSPCEQLIHYRTLAATTSPHPEHELRPPRIKPRN